MKRFINFSALVILLVSCEYQLEETNFREIEPPSDYAYIEINLNDIHPLDTIYICVPTKFTLKLDAGQLKIHDTDIRINGSSVEKDVQSPSNVSFLFFPEYYANGMHTLKVNCITNSGTRSLADILGYEGYQFEVFWNIKVVNLYDGFKGGYRILEDGQVELYWDNPFLPDALIERYRFHTIYSSVNLNPMQKSIIINDYVCGKSIYSIETYIDLGIAGYRNPKYSLYIAEIVIDTPVPKIYIEDLDQNKLRIYWDKPAVANAKYTVKYGHKYRSKNDISNLTDTTIIVPRPAIGTHFECKVDFYPSKPSHTWPYASSDTSFFYGKKVGFDFYSNKYYYSVAENVVYAVVGDSIAVININTLDSRRTKLENYTYPNILYYCITSQNSSKFAVVIYDNKLVVYDDSKLLSPTVFDIQDINSSFLISDKFLFEFTRSASYIYDLATGLIINTQPAIGFNVKMSVDGRYFACYSGNDISNTIDLYMFNYPDFTKVGTCTNSHQSSHAYNYDFHPNRPEQIIIEWTSPNDRTIDIYQLPQFEKLQSTNMPYGTRVINIDPVTELVAYEYNNTTIIAPLSDLNKQLYINSDYSPCYLYSGCLFSSNGYAADIKKELFQQ